MKTHLYKNIDLKIHPMHNFRFLLSFITSFFIYSATAQVVIDLPSSHFVCEGEFIQFSPTISGGDGNYSFSWSPAINLSDPSIQSPTINTIASSTITYTLVVSDGNNLQSTASTTLTVVNNVEIDINNTVITDIACNGSNTGSIDLSLINNDIIDHDFLWSNGETVQDINNLSAGTYYVTVTRDGCSDTASFTVNEPNTPLQISTQVTDTDCGNNNGSIELTVTGGTPAYSYAWSNGDVTQNINNLNENIYSVTVTDAAGCFAITSVTVGNGTDLVVDAGADVFVCEGESVNLSAFALGGSGTGYSYLWNTNETTPNIVVTPTPTQTTTYSITLTDSNGCASIDQVTVNVSPTPIITGSVMDIDCNGAATGSIFINVANPGVSFLWSTGTTTQNITGLSAGTYCVTVVDFNGCQAESCFTIAEPSFMDVQILGGPEQSCDTNTPLEAIITGGTAPYIFEWVGPNGFASNTPQIIGNNLENGIYTITITDANGCQVTQSIEIDNLLHIALSALPLDCVSGATTINTTGTSTGADITYLWEGPNGFTSNNLDITIDVAGSYTLTVTNTSIPDCFDTQNIDIYDGNADLSDGIGLDITECNIYSLYAILPFEIIVPIDILWTFPDGSTSTDEVISATMTGIYTLTTSISQLNCEYHSSYFVDLESEACSVLEGYVRYDQSSDCVADNNEPHLPNIIVTANSADGTFNAITDDAGYYRFNLPSDDYTITTSLPSPSWTTCEDTYSVDLTTAGSTHILNIPLQGEGLCPDLSVSLTSWILRRCFTNNFYLTVCNEGTETALFPELALVLDDYLLFSNASITPSSINGQQLNWTFDEIGVGECVTIVFWATVSCDAELGQTHCSEAHVTSYPFCGSEGDWSGASLDLSANCNDNEVVFNIRNNGTGDLNETVSYIVIEDGVAMMDAAGTINDLAIDNETQLSFPANGSTYTLVLDQASNHPYTVSMTNSIEGCGNNSSNSFSTGFVNQFSQQTATSSSTVFCQENIGSYDPNDKAAIPVGYGAAHYIEPEDKLNYHIRFQNTGTDTAFTVVIRDTLSDLLDIRTLEPGNSSHDYELDIFGEKVLSFTFNNILLVDSFTNEADSHGFVDFSIRPKLDTPLESLLENNAAIFFDFNEPVITNTVFHTIGRNFYDIVNWKDFSDLNLSLKLFPNPSTEKVSLVLKDAKVSGQLIRISDMNGHLVFEGKFNQQEMALDVQSWPSSWYAIQLFDSNGQLLGSGKLIKQ